jgi:1-phosphofructokinase
MGLKTDLIHVKEGMTRVNVKIKAAEETEINGIGPVITEADMAKLCEKLDAIGPGDLLVLSGSIPSCLPGDTYERIMARLDGRGIPIAVDATKDLLVNVLKYHPFLIKPNNHELGEIFGRVLKSDGEIADCARRLQEMGARNVLVSMAGAGALLLDETGRVHRIGCPKGKVQNSVGAGDSMVAGFLAGWLETGDYGYALKLGTATGSATAFSIGLAEKPLIDELLATL